MNRPVLHNMYLPGWIHRFANGAIGGIAGIGAGMVAIRYYSAPVSALWLGALTFAVAAAFDPKRFTLVEGCAGEVGYNELEPPPSNSVQLTRNSFGWLGVILGIQRACRTPLGRATENLCLVEGLNGMPVISMFYGITISLYFLDDRRHHRPHIHARFQGDEAVIAIPDGEVLEGKLPPGKMKMVLAWVEIHRDDLIADWELAFNGQQPFRIEPLR